MDSDDTVAKVYIEMVYTSWQQTIRHVRVTKYKNSSRRDILGPVLIISKHS
jgi:hypothetical protein